MRLVLVAAGLALALGACTAGDDALDAVAAARASPAVVPDGPLVEGGWPEVAAFVAAQAEQGRPTVVNVFASWCAPCRDELPVLLAAARERDDVAFLGVDHLDLRPDAQALVDELDVTIPTVFDDVGDVMGAIQGRGMPTTAFFDARGRLVELHTGPLTAPELDARLDDLA